MTDAFQAENSQMNAGIADNYGKDRKNVPPMRSIRNEYEGEYKWKCRNFHSKNLKKHLRS